MTKLLAIGAMLTGVASLLSGGACLLMHFGAGDLMDGGHLKECLALFAAGVATFSPGLHALKGGPFTRPDEPTPASPAAPVVAGVLAFLLLCAPISAHAWSRYDCASLGQWATSNGAVVGHVVEGLVTLGMMGTPTLIQLTQSTAGPLPVAHGWGDPVGFVGFGVSWLKGYLQLGVSPKGIIQTTAHLLCIEPFE